MCDWWEKQTLFVSPRNTRQIEPFAECCLVHSNRALCWVLWVGTRQRVNGLGPTVNGDVRSPSARTPFAKRRRLLSVLNGLLSASSRHLTNGVSFPYVLCLPSTNTRQRGFCRVFCVCRVLLHMALGKHRLKELGKYVSTHQWKNWANMLALTN